MRLLPSLILLACTTLQVVSAIPVPKPANDLVARDEVYTFSAREGQILEARGQKGGDHKSSSKPKPKVPDPLITFEGGIPHSAQDRLDELNLSGGKRKKVEDYHRKVVKDYMSGIDEAHSAVITHVAHSIGSRDSDRIHISAIIKKADGTIIGIPRPPEIPGHRRLKTHHIYTNKEDPYDGYKVLPIEYRKAIDKEGVHPGRA